MRIYILLAMALATSACASNILDTDLLASNTIMLPPTTARTVFVQNRNSSDNQQVTLTDLGARLAAKNYQVVQDPKVAAYVVLTNIVYCNQTQPELPVENIVAGGYGSGLGSSVMSGLHSVAGMAGMMGPQGAVAGGVASMGLGAVSSIGSAVGNLFSGPSGPKPTENIEYACVADLQITDRANAGAAATQTAAQAGSPQQSGTPSAGVYQTRLAASVHQKKFDEI